MQPRDSLRRVEIARLHEVEFEGAPLTKALRKAYQNVVTPGFAELDQTQEKLKALAGDQTPGHDQLDAVRALHQFGENILAKPKLKAGEPVAKDQMQLFLSMVHYLTPADAPEAQRAVEMALKELKLPERLPEEALAKRLATLPQQLVSKRARS